jgi:predicted metal-binding protein
LGGRVVSARHAVALTERFGAKTAKSIRADVSVRTEKALSLVALAKRLGATKAKAIPADDIVVDERVRLKCSVPLCSNHGKHLLCPPNIMTVEEFRRIVSAYSTAIIIQLEADYDSSDKSPSRLSGQLQKRLETETGGERWEKRLHSIVAEVEAAAFKSGFYLAAGLIGSECLLCPECVGQNTGQECRHPFQARPSMQAVGIDVVRTCKKAGMPVSLSSKTKVKWTGLVLLE